ncbi:MAG: hypothetical protein HY659_03800 [Rhizobiales bacterium]|nr:hypothetical protein [Hyphomicrobiales bacterium]
MLLGLRFLFGAGLACLLITGLAFALVATFRLAHNADVRLIAPTRPAVSEIVGPERQTSGTGGPYIAPIIIPVPNASTPAPSTVPSGAATATPSEINQGAVSSTASISDDRQANKAEAQEPPKESEPAVKPVVKRAPRSRTVVTPETPAPLDFPFRYFLN